MYSNFIQLSKSYFATYRGLSAMSYYGLIISLIESIFIGIYYYLTIYFVNVLHFDISTAGMIISCYGIGAVFGGILGGRLSDEWSPEIISAFALLFQSLVYFLFIKIQTVFFLMCNVFILGIVSYAFVTSNQLFVLNYCDASDSQRLKAINLLSMTSNLGFALSALIMGFFIDFGFHIIFLTGAVLVFLLSCLSFILTWKINQTEKYQVSISNPSSNHASIQIKPNKKNLIFILSSLFFVGLIVTQLGTTYTIYIKSSFPDLGMQAVTILFALNSLLVVLLSTSLGEIIKKYNKMIMVGIGSFLLGSGMFMLTLSNSFFLALLSCIIYTFGEIIFFSVSLLVCYQNGLANQKGKSLGLYRMVYALSRMVGPFVGGMVYTKWSGDAVWILSGIIGCICLLGCFLLKKS